MKVLSRLYQISCLLVLCLFLMQGQVWADMYQCVGADGSMRYTDTMESEACRPLQLKKTTIFERDWGENLQGDPEKYEPIIRYYAVRYDIDPHLIRAVIRCESGFNPRAVSRKGAQGLMQLMPGTAQELQVRNPFNPKENIAGGTKYLRKLLDVFEQDVKLALAAYNAGPTLVKKERKIPRIAETRKYVSRVLQYYREYKNG